MLAHLKDRKPGPALLIAAVCLACCMARAAEAPVISVSGVLGQTQPEEEPPLPTLGFDGAVRDGEGVLWAAAGIDLYGFATTNGSVRLVAIRRLPQPAQRGLAYDGRMLYGCSGSGHVMVLDPRDLDGPAKIIATAAKTTRGFTVVPLGNHQGFAAQGDIFLLTDDGVLAFNRDGSDRGTMLRPEKPADADWFFCAIGFEPDSGDLAIGSYYPDVTMYRYRPTGKLFASSLWPRTRLFTDRTAQAHGRLWALTRSGPFSDLTEIMGPDNEPRTFPVRWAVDVTGLAEADHPDHVWLASSQGLLLYDLRRQRVIDRMGGLPGVTGMAVSDSGEMIAVAGNRERMIRLWADDEAGARFRNDGREKWLLGGTRQHRASSITWDGKYFVLLDETAGRLWRFDPWHAGWREQTWLGLTPENSFPSATAVASGGAGLWWLTDDDGLMEGRHNDYKDFKRVGLPAEIAFKPQLLAVRGDRLVLLGDATNVAALSRSVTGEYRAFWQRRDISGVVSLAADRKYAYAVDTETDSVHVLGLFSGETLMQIDADLLGRPWQPTAAATYGPWLFVADASRHEIIRFRVAPAPHEHSTPDGKEVR